VSYINGQEFKHCTILADGFYTFKLDDFGKLRQWA